MSDQTVPRFNVHTADWTPFPEFGGHEAVLYKSEDGTRLAASFRLSGTHSWVTPYDDFFFVVGGSAKITVEGRGSFEVVAGDFCYIRQGMSVTFEMSDDFHEVSVLVSDTSFDHIDH